MEPTHIIYKRACRVVINCIIQSVFIARNLVVGRRRDCCIAGSVSDCCALRGPALKRALCLNTLYKPVDLKCVQRQQREVISAILSACVPVIRCDLTTKIARNDYICLEFRNLLICRLFEAFVISNKTIHYEEAMCKISPSSC